MTDEKKRKQEELINRETESKKATADIRKSRFHVFSLRKQRLLDLAMEEDEKDHRKND